MDSQVDGSFSKDTSWALVLAWYSGPPGGLIRVDEREHGIQGKGVYSSPPDLGRKWQSDRSGRAGARQLCGPSDTSVVTIIDSVIKED
jgi:hypothetical protein